jgi:hypothetical protein
MKYSRVPAQEIFCPSVSNLLMIKTKVPAIDVILIK